MQKKTCLKLAKDNLKFSAAHFLIFDKNKAEKLHGHNYQVEVLISFKESQKETKGFQVDFSVLKKDIKKRLDQWDEVILLPAKQPDMKFKASGKSLHVYFRDRYYVFPKNEVIMLPVPNTSVEALSLLLAEDFYNMFSKFKVIEVEVKVEETRGQGAISRVS